MAKKENKICITKKRLLREVNNDMTHNWYYEFRFRIYSDERHYYKGNFVLWFDADEVCSYYDKDSVTKREIAAYADEIGGIFLASGAPNGEVTPETLKPFYEQCRQTIIDYNKANG